MRHQVLGPKLFQILLVALIVPAVRAQDGDWHSTFHLSDLDADCLGLASYTSPAGERLVALGAFECAGPEVVHRVATWDGSRWSALGRGLGGGSSVAFCATEFDDGSGPALYVGGRFASAGDVAADNVARWDGATWSPLGAGVGWYVRALAGHDDGSGPALYAAGDFTSAGGQPALGIARWDGAAWPFPEAGLDGEVRALASYDDGSGPALFAGGSFEHAGGIAAPGIARWDGQGWSALAPGLHCWIRALAVHDDGTGPALYAGGAFSVPSGPARHGIARWKQGAWTFSASLPFAASASALVEHDQGGGIGPELFLGGPIYTLGAVWKLRGGSLLQVGATYPSDPSSLLALASVDLGAGPRLVAAGWFKGIHPGFPLGDIPALNVAEWDGASWSRMGTGGQGLDAGVAALATLSSSAGTAEQVVALGWFSLAGDQPLAGAGRWDGSAWTALADGRSGIRAVIEDPRTAGSGAFFAALAHEVARWDGTAWSRLRGLEGEVTTFAITASATGPELVAAGHLDVKGASAGQALARWDGESWRALGLRGEARALASWVPSAGATALLVAAGSFDAPLSGEGVAYLHDGVWSWLGGAIVQGTTFALAAVPRGQRSDLYLGGQFSAVAGVSARSIARWDGAAWSPLPGGVAGDVLALAVRGEGPAAELVVAGEFELAGGTPAWNIARWDGLAWSVLGPARSPGTNARIHALAVVGASVFAGGVFTQAGGLPSSHLARWGP